MQSLRGTFQMVYLPAHFAENDEAVLFANMERYDFAMVITSGLFGLRCSQVPILVQRRDNKVILQGHLARPNPQCADIDGSTEALVVFAGPHAYISPSWYKSHPAVPTWNYVAVHARGVIRAIDDHEWLRQFLLTLSNRHEQYENNPWQMQDLPETYLSSMIKGIVGFEIEASKIEGKFKLSQNRPEPDYPEIIAALEARDDADSHAIAQLMRELKKRRDMHD
jgi:transcriptional regulator